MIWLFGQKWGKFGQFEELQPLHLIYWRELATTITTSTTIIIIITTSTITIIIIISTTNII